MTLSLKTLSLMTLCAMIPMILGIVQHCNDAWPNNTQQNRVPCFIILFFSQCLSVIPLSVIHLSAVLLNVVAQGKRDENNKKILKQK